MFAIRYQPSEEQREGQRERDVWCLLFVLIRQGLRGGSGPQRLIRALGEETGNPIMAFHRPSFSPSCERAPHHNTTENSLRAVVHRLDSVAGLAEPALSLIGHTLTQPQTLPRGDTHYPPFGMHFFLLLVGFFR